MFMNTVEDVLKSWNVAYAFSCVGQESGLAEFSIKVKLSVSTWDRCDFGDLPKTQIQWMSGESDDESESVGETDESEEKEPKVDDLLSWRWHSSFAV